MDAVGVVCEFDPLHRGHEALLRRAVLLCQADSEELRPTLAELHACLGMVAETQQISIKNIL